jgi:hypothetical protein
MGEAELYVHEQFGIQESCAARVSRECGGLGSIIFISSASPRSSMTGGLWLFCGVGGRRSTYSELFLLRNHGNLDYLSYSKLKQPTRITNDLPNSCQICFADGLCRGSYYWRNLDWRSVERRSTSEEGNCLFKNLC